MAFSPSAHFSYALSIIFALSFSLTACGGGGGSTPSVPNVPVNVNVQVDGSPTAPSGSGSPVSGNDNSTSNTGGSNSTSNTPPATSTPPTAGTSTSIETPLAEARFNSPRGVAINGKGDLYVADTGNYVVRKITRTGIVTTIAGVSGQQGTANGVGSNALFADLRAITIDRNDNVYVIDGHAIRMISPDRTVSLVAGVVSTPGYSDRPRQDALFNTPFALFADANDDVVVADTGNNAIRRISNGNVSTITTTAHPPLTLVSSGTKIFFCDSFSVWSTDYQGNMQRIAGNYDDPYKRIDGVGLNARFMTISTITMAPSGNLYIGETFTPAKSTPNGTMRRMVPVFRNTDWDVSTIGSTWDGAAYGATSDISGNIYLADYAKHVIRKVSSDGNTTIYAGALGEKGANY